MLILNCFNRDLDLGEPVILVVLVPDAVDKTFPWIVHCLITVVFNPLIDEGIGVSYGFLGTFVQDRYDEGVWKPLEGDSVSFDAKICHRFAEFHVDILLTIFSVMIHIEAVFRHGAF